MNLQITFIGHATLLIEFNQCKILCDPHLLENFSEGLFSYFPNRRVDLDLLVRPDVIFISHKHRDHFDLPSLNCLDKDVPVICANDMEIIYGLSCLGFKDINPLSDWEEIQLNHSRIIFTPSLYRVPEHGLLIDFGTYVVWNMVDTLVDASIIKKLDQTLGGKSVNLLFWPYQPLIETDAPSNLPIKIPLKRFSEKVKTVQSLHPDIVIPYSDGQFGQGPASWLNHYKFPISYDNACSVIQSVSPQSEIFEPLPGNVLSINSSRRPVVLRSDGIELMQCSSADKNLDTTREILSLEETLLPSHLKLTSSVSALSDWIQNQWLEALQNPFLYCYLQSMLFWRVEYRIVLIDDQGPITIKLIHPDLESKGCHQGEQNSITSNYMQVMLHSAVFQALIESRFHFVAALLSGLLRSSERIFLFSNGSIITPSILREGRLEDIDEPYPLLCPISLLNNLIATQGNVEKEIIDHELSLVLSSD